MRIIIYARSNTISLQDGITLEEYRCLGCSQSLPIKVKDVFRFGNTVEELQVLFVADLQSGYTVKFLDKAPFTIEMGCVIFKYVHARVNGFDCVINWNDVVWSNPYAGVDDPVNEIEKMILSCDKPGMFSEMLLEHMYVVSKLVSLKRVVFNRETGTPEMIVKRHENGMPVITEQGDLVYEPVYVMIQKPLIIRI